MSVVKMAIANANVVRLTKVNSEERRMKNPIALWFQFAIATQSQPNYEL